MSGRDGQDRRKQARIQRRLPIRFGTEAKMCGGTVVDISEGGLRVESVESFPANSVVQVFVQFPRHAIRLRARVAWVSPTSPAMGFSFTRPEPSLARAYQSWIAEVKRAASEEPGRAGAGEAAGSSSSAALPPGASDAREAPPPGGDRPTPAGAGAAAVSAPPREPKGPRRRRVETRSGQAYDVLIERQAGEWTVTIHQSPRQPGVTAPDFEQSYRDYASAERALGDFLKSH
ncbi:MAG: PilZ domain-containing protein [Acidobacteriota bacterium]